MIRALFIGTLLLSLASPAFAVRQYRCDGRVQYEPCGRPAVASDAVTRANPPGRTISNSSKFARVLVQNLSLISGEQGIWRGIIEGQGDVALSLHLVRAGRVIERRFMGKVFLNNKSTWFAFKSSLPDGSDWSWKIVAKVS